MGYSIELLVLDRDLIYKRLTSHYYSNSPEAKKESMERVKDLDRAIKAIKLSKS